METEKNVTEHAKPQLGFARTTAWSLLTPVARRAARAYIAGSELEDALRVRRHCAAAGVATTIGYFNRMQDSPRLIADQNLACLKAVAGTSDYISIKLSTLDYSGDLLSELIQAGATSKVRLHLDSLQPETADPSWAMIKELLSANVACDLGCTLAARWSRAVEDARWARQQPLFIRVVKGEWADPHEPNRDARDGFLAVIEELARGARHVAVATHDVPLATEAFSRLQANGVSCGMELLYGLPMRGSLALAKRLNVPVRLYIPYGQEMLRYAVNKVLRHPHIGWQLAKDFVHSIRRPDPLAGFSGHGDSRA
jgi:proline dehydrogenase